MFEFNPLYLSDGYKVGHRRMLAKNTTRLYGTWIPRAVKYAPKGVNKVVSFGQSLVVQWLDAQFKKFFFNKPWGELEGFVNDMTNYLQLPYNGDHFKDLHDLGYLPLKIKSLPEGIETNANIPHMTFVNTVDSFGWLTLYVETIISAASWKLSTSATIALLYRRNVEKWVKETDPANSFSYFFLCHDFSARGLSPWDMITSGLGHATAFMGSDTLPVIPASRKYYGVGEDEMPIGSVNASEHSVSTTKIFTVGEKQMLVDWCKEFPSGILSVVSDTFDLWKLITEYLVDIKDEVMARDGKLVIRPDSGDPVDIICGLFDDDGITPLSVENYNDPLVKTRVGTPAHKGVIELLWDIFGGTVNDQGYKVLDSHVGCIYGDSITTERQIQIYERLKAKGFAATNIVLGVGSFTYQFNTRDTLGFAAKGSWFEVKTPTGRFDGEYTLQEYNIYKDPITDDGTKKSLKGLQQVFINGDGEYEVKSECTWDEESKGVLQTIYENGKFSNLPTLNDVREQINQLTCV